ncbi:glycolipid 2-alpha-mannosyltransferase [Pseudomassariella vexata]|uniref:Glycolipid 2-alpha-mannosyltransferase n=1 Tax=Pseudomassariella vexata TaxID=1141098 RepID=A0A1Y2DJ01_9PEZI|nr:glycolipid 2-alpha-mannosyltransferase [Pseudomassariella vexata]ORY59156.1 glycolipid 2-alpha-mannosyltransferase [Pseudomassariella vexata]
MLQSLLRPVRRLSLWLVVPITAALFLEVCLHLYYYHVPIPDHELDTPFFTSCQEPDLSPSTPRENAVLVMLARNSELKKAKITIESIERSFNRWYNYPIVFLNDEPWSQEFVRQLNETSKGKASFEVIPKGQWTFPEWVDAESARQSMKQQGQRGIPHGGDEGTIICAGFTLEFYQLEALKKYKWYWRLEPDVEFSCSITYDPFVQMAKNKHVYGFTIALWEVGTTCPSLFRNVVNWMEQHEIKPSDLWKATMEGSWMPYPFRKLMSLLPHRDRRGDAWSLCHYWSNFEIADMDFFRSRQYQTLFEYLDGKEGFYYERWGDAAVHSLAVAMLLKPEKVHHFEDFGYRHGNFYQCPANAPGGQLPESERLGKATLPKGNPEVEGGIGCRCQCDRRPHGGRNFSGYCMTLQQPNSRERPWLAWFLQDRSMWRVRVLVFGAVCGCAVLGVRCWLSRWSRRIIIGVVVMLGLAVFLNTMSRIM